MRAVSRDGCAPFDTPPAAATQGEGDMATWRGVRKAPLTLFVNYDYIFAGVAFMKKKDFELARGSGNVFRDFDDPHADLKQAKAILAARIIAVLDERNLTVRKAAGMTSFAAADFSRIRNANLGRFTLDRLMKMLAALDGRIRVTVHLDTQRGVQAAVSVTGR